MSMSLKNIITKGLGMLFIIATLRARDAGEYWLLIGTFGTKGYKPIHTAFLEK